MGATDHNKVRKDLQQITSVCITPSEQMSQPAVGRCRQLIYVTYMLYFSLYQRVGGWLKLLKLEVYYTHWPVAGR